MKKILLVLTRKYPYSFGEPFLESEIEKHTKYFDRTIVLAQDVSSGEKLTRTVPTGIESFVTATGKRKTMRISDWLHMPMQIVAPDADVKDEKVSRRLSFSQKVFLGYFEARVKRTYLETKTLLDNIDFDTYEQVTIYSYWLFVNAVVAVNLRDYLKNERGYNGKIVVLSRAHRYDIYEDVNKLKYLPFRKKLLQGLDYIYPCSDNGTKYLKNNYTNISAKIDTAYLGTRDYGLSKESDDCFHILSVSRVVKVKRLELLIDELSKIQPNGKKIMWTHIGAGVEGKSAYYESIKSYAHQKLNNISFEFLGVMQNTDVYEYYHNHSIDVFVNVSASEGLPVSLMEASSFGIPLIATDVGGSSEIIDGDKNGYLLKKDFNEGELTEKLEIMISASDEEKKNYRRAARKLWENKFDGEKNYTFFAKSISQL